MVSDDCLFYFIVKAIFNQFRLHTWMWLCLFHINCLCNYTISTIIEHFINFPDGDLSSWNIQTVVSGTSVDTYFSCRLNTTHRLHFFASSHKYFNKQTDLAVRCFQFCMFSIKSCSKFLCHLVGYISVTWCVPSSGESFRWYENCRCASERYTCFSVRADVIYFLLLPFDYELHAGEYESSRERIFC